MKVGNIIKLNQKGQIVIPQEFRKSLDIKSNIPLNIIRRGGGLFIYPIKEVIASFESENSYYKILEKTRGKWKEYGNKLMAGRRKIELAASKNRKKEW